MTERIGILVGQEQSFPQAFMAKVNETPVPRGVRAGSAVPEGFDSPYRVIVDRLSHEGPSTASTSRPRRCRRLRHQRPLLVERRREVLRVLPGLEIGVTVPRTVMLPQGVPALHRSGRSLRNLEYPLDWEGITKYVGFPAILKPADGGGWKNVPCRAIGYHFYALYLVSVGLAWRRFSIPPPSAGLRIAGKLTCSAMLLPVERELEVAQARVLGSIDGEVILLRGKHRPGTVTPICEASE